MSRWALLLLSFAEVMFRGYYHSFWHDDPNEPSMLLGPFLDLKRWKILSLGRDELRSASAQTWSLSHSIEVWYQMNSTECFRTMFAKKFSQPQRRSKEFEHEPPTHGLHESHESPRHERYERRIQRLWEMKRSNEEEKVSLLFVRSNVSHEVGTQQEGEIHRWEHGWKRCDRKKKASIGSTRARIIVTTAYFGRIITVRVESFRGLLHMFLHGCLESRCPWYEDTSVMVSRGSPAGFGSMIHPTF